MKPVRDACKILDKLRASSLKGGSVGSGKKQKGCNLQVFFMVLLLKMKHVMSRNWCPIHIFLQCNNFADFKWSHSRLSVAVWKEESDPSVSLENFLLSKYTGNGFAYDCYECARFWNASSCSTNLQQFSNVMHMQQTRDFLARTVKQGRNAWPFRNFKSRSKWIMTYLVCYIFLYIEEALIADEEKKQTCCLLYRLSHTEMFKLEMSWKHWLRSFVSLWMALVYLIYFDECLYSELHE